MTIYGHRSVVVEKDVPGSRWRVLDTKGEVIVHVPFRLAGGLEAVEELCLNPRYPKGDARRYDKDRLLALELCLAKMPLAEGEGLSAWRPLLLNDFEVTRVPEKQSRARLNDTAMQAEPVLHSAAECSTTTEDIPAVRQGLRRRLL